MASSLSVATEIEHENMIGMNIEILISIAVNNA